MSDDLVQVAKAATELEPAVEAFAEATGALQPIREATAWAADLIRYQRLPHQARLLMKAAKKIKASGLPPRAVSDKLLRAVLEDGPMEDDEDMQERWANLLANAATYGGGLRSAFPKILAELEPDEAALLDDLADRTTPNGFRKKDFRVEECGKGGHLSAFDNLGRLALLHLMRTTDTSIGGTVSEGEIYAVRFTQLGWDFVSVCRAPG